MNEPENKPLITFTPVPVRTRRDGGTEARSLSGGEAITRSDKHIAFTEAPPSVRTRTRARRTANFGNFRGPADPRRHYEHS